jgi:hypothetical protein
MYDSSLISHVAGNLYDPVRIEKGILGFTRASFSLVRFRGVLDVEFTCTPFLS